MQPGDKATVANDVVVEGSLAFARGETVAVEQVSPNPQSPEHKYVVMSVRLGKRFQLRDAHFAEPPAQVPVPPAPAPLAKPKGSKKKTILVVVGVIVGILIVGGIIFGLTKDKEEATPKKETKTVETEKVEVQPPREATGIDYELFEAVMNGNLDAVKKAIEAGACVNAWLGDSGGTPLDTAASLGYTDIASLLLDRGADVNARTKSGFPPLFGVGNIETAALLIDRGADVNARTKNGLTPLFAVIGEDHTEIAALLLDRGADVNARDNDAVTPLHGAALLGDTEIAALLLDRGANVDAQDKDGLTPLHGAAGQGNTETAALLLDRGADVYARNNKYFWTPVYMALAGGHTETMDLFRQHCGYE